MYLYYKGKKNSHDKLILFSLAATERITVVSRGRGQTLSNEDSIFTTVSLSYEWCKGIASGGSMSRRNIKQRRNGGLGQLYSKGYLQVNSPWAQ